MQFDWFLPVFISHDKDAASGALDWSIQTQGFIIIFTESNSFVFVIIVGQSYYLFLKVFLNDTLFIILKRMINKVSFVNRDGLYGPI